MRTLMQYINSAQLYFLQFIGSVCKTPVEEDGDFAKKSVVAQRNRYKDKFPCKLKIYIMLSKHFNVAPK